MCSVLTFLRDERGSQTIEFVLWIPIIGALMVLVADAFILYMTHTEMWNVARDTARRMTTTQLASKADAELHAYGELALFGFPYEVDATYDPASSMVVLITLDAGDTTFFGFTLFGGTMRAQVVMRSEPA